jgi:hypothetical protein
MNTKNRDELIRANFKDEAELESYRKKYEELATLKPGEVLKFIPDSKYHRERVAFQLIQGGSPGPGNTIAEGCIVQNFNSQLTANSWSDRGFNAFDIFRHLNQSSYSFNENIFNDVIPGDWVIQYNPTFEIAISNLESIYKEVFKKNIKISFHKSSAPILIIKKRENTPNLLPKLNFRLRAFKHRLHDLLEFKYYDKSEKHQFFKLIRFLFIVLVYPINIDHISIKSLAGMASEAYKVPIKTDLNLDRNCAIINNETNVPYESEEDYAKKLRVVVQKIISREGLCLEEAIQPLPVITEVEIAD